MAVSEMNCLQSYEGNRCIRNRVFSGLLSDFVPGSSAAQGMALAPSLTADKLPGLFADHALLWHTRDGFEEDLALRKEEHVVLVTFRTGHAVLEVFATTRTATPILKELLIRLEPYRFQNKEEDGIWVGFAFRDNRGLVCQRNQFLRCPAWRDIQGNYPPETRRSLDRLIQLREPWHRGTLLVWHGPPGTGKTFAIRALMMGWRGHFDFVVVTDPERFVSMPEYYYEVASGSRDHPEGPDEERAEVVAPDSQRKLFILEDAADLVLRESRSAHYDKIGKLLNMTDGLFGQGREDVFLVTFNEQVDEIDPAFMRAGRCIAMIEFPTFSAAEAASWFRERGINPSGDHAEFTLAEMYSQVREEEGKEEADKDGGLPFIGFRGGRNGR